MSFSSSMTVDRYVHSVRADEAWTLNCKMAGTRWSEARDALMDVAEQAAMYDEDGVDVFFLNSKVKGTGMKVRLRTLLWLC